MTEYDFVKNLLCFLKADGFEVYMEVPNMGQSMDVVACQNDRLMGIEAKLSNWRRGLAQCKAHEIVCDYVCLAIASKNISPTLESEIRLRGYGLIHYNQTSNECNWVIEPEKNSKVWMAQRAIFNRRVEERKKCPIIIG